MKLIVTTGNKVVTVDVPVDIDAVDLCTDTGVYLGGWKAPVTPAEAASPIQGVTTCGCGCKYWENGRCIDCGDRP